MEWDSPWGVGFPGWHIECSAMAAKYLGSFFDIHCGGEDHISVHHPNEIAQAQACYGTRLANFWMHGYFLQIDESRMGKSVGNFLRLQSLVDQGYDPLAWRYFCLNAHYRAKLNFNWEAVSGAQTALNRLRTAAFDMGTPGRRDEAYLDKFVDCVNADLNAPRALPWSGIWFKVTCLPLLRKPSCSNSTASLVWAWPIGSRLRRLFPTKS